MPAISLDLLKWAVSLFVGFLAFLGSSYEHTYFRMFGVADFSGSADITRLAINAVNLVQRLGVGLWFVALLVAAWGALRFLPRADARAIGIGALVLGFALAGWLGAAQARSDALALATGKSGRIAWCIPKEKAFSADVEQSFTDATRQQQFRLLFQRDGFLFLVTVPSGGDKGGGHGIQGQVLVAKRDDFSMCRFTGDNIG